MNIMYNLLIDITIIDSVDSVDNIVNNDKVQEIFVKNLDTYFDVVKEIYDVYDIRINPIISSMEKLPPPHLCDMDNIQKERVKSLILEWGRGLKN